MLTQLLFGIGVAISYSLIPIVLLNLFPKEIRVSGISLPYNVANMVGGLSPLIATTLIHVTNVLIIPGLYLSVIACITLLVVWTMEVE